MFQDELRGVEPTQRSAVSPRDPGRHPQSPEPAAHVPIIENLTPQYMSAHAPTILIAFLDQPIVPEHLGVEIKHLERRMVHVRFGPLEEKEGVVVDKLLATVQVHECGDVAAFCVVQQVGGFEVEVAGPEVEGCGEVGDGHAEVAEFVDLGRACWGYVRWGCIWDGVCGC